MLGMSPPPNFDPHPPDPPDGWFLTLGCDRLILTSRRFVPRELDGLRRQGLQFRLLLLPSGSVLIEAWHPSRKPHVRK